MAANFGLGYISFKPPQSPESLEKIGGGMLRYSPCWSALSRATLQSFRYLKVGKQEWENPENKTKKTPHSNNSLCNSFDQNFVNQFHSTRRKPIRKSTQTHPHNPLGFDIFVDLKWKTSRPLPSASYPICWSHLPMMTKSKIGDPSAARQAQANILFELQEKGGKGQVDLFDDCIFLLLCGWSWLKQTCAPKEQMKKCLCTVHWLSRKHNSITDNSQRARRFGDFFFI